MSSGLGWWGVPLGIAGGALRVSAAYLFVSLGECITEKSGRINLGLEGTLLIGAMSGFGISYLTNSPWLGVAVAAISGAMLGLLHAWLCSRPRVNDVAVGIALMFLGMGFAFFFGKGLLDKQAPQLPTIPLAFWSHNDIIRHDLSVNVLLIVGALLAPLLLWSFKNTRWGLVLRVAGESADAARAMGYSVQNVRAIATMVGGGLAGIGGAFLTLYYPGSWNEMISSGQGLMAVALVIFARWNPVYCLGAALLFGGAGSIGSALQSVGITSYTYLFKEAPSFLTLAIMIITCSPTRHMAGAPAELGTNNS